MLTPYKKPNGETLDVNATPATIKYIESLGWVKCGNEDPNKEVSNDELEALKAQAKDAGVYDSVNWNIKGKRKIAHVKADLEKALNDSQDSDN